MCVCVNLCVWWWWWWVGVWPRRAYEALDHLNGCLHRWLVPAPDDDLDLLSQWFDAHSATGTRTQVARVRAEYPSQLDYSGLGAAVRALFVKIQELSCFCQELKRTAAEWLRPLKPVGCPRAGSKPTGVLQTFAPPCQGE